MRRAGPGRVGWYDGHRREPRALAREEELDEASTRTVSARRRAPRRLDAMHSTAESSLEYVSAVYDMEQAAVSSSAQAKAGLAPNAGSLAHTGRFWSTTGWSG